MKYDLRGIASNIPGVKGLAEIINSVRGQKAIRAIDEDLAATPLNLQPNPSDPLQRDLASHLSEFQSKRKYFNKIIIWGFRTRTHTHRFIHRHFYDTLIKLGDSNVTWVDDNPESEHLIDNGDLVVAMNMASQHLPFKKGVYYCLHNIDNPRKNDHLVVNLQVYSSGLPFDEFKLEEWEKVTLFCAGNRTLYQPWGTDLLPSEFYTPVFSGGAETVYWIGSIWNNPANQGNVAEIQELKNVVQQQGLRFVHKENISVHQNIKLVRASRIAPAVSGRFQVAVNYLPCRVFKNISYGQCAITNVKAFDWLLGDSNIGGENIRELVFNALSLTELDYTDLVHQQQAYIANHHTYLNKWIHIFTAFEHLY